MAAVVADSSGGNPERARVMIEDPDVAAFELPVVLVHRTDDLHPGCAPSRRELVGIVDVEGTFAQQEAVRLVVVDGNLPPIRRRSS